ncbi:MAG: tetratricopeptide repeat protein [Salinibacter sp.]|uniref:tetratricopeptide repeat protein n=1 Tax=Salinibacter sp. TaxID=2065818 RepID=UPI0035D45216
MLIGGAVGLLFGLGVGCSSDPPPGSTAAPPDSAGPARAASTVSIPDSARYLGDKACASCHPDVTSSYRKTGHGQSISTFDPGTAPERFSGNTVVQHEKSGLSYEAFVRNDTLYQREFRRGPNGKIVHERVHKAAYVIGSGNATRSYLMEVNGYLTEMPLTWYADQEKWDMSPGYEGANDRFSRKINLQCMSCHAGRPERSPFTQNHYPKAPTNITCERCHGPGETHVQRQRKAKKEKTTKANDLAIVDPTSLPRAEELSVCQQCHLAGITVFEPGETPTSFRPGEPLSTNRTVYVPEKQLEDPDWVGIDSHPIRLARSACFENSNMTCSTCHEPHQPAATTTTKEYNSTCRSCHGGERSAQPVCSRPNVSRDKAMTGNCVSCHMQKGGTSDVPHVTFTDHWIRKRPGPPRDPSAGRPSFDTTGALQLAALRRMEALDGTSPPPDRADAKATVAYFRFYETMHRHPEYIRRAIDHGREGRVREGAADGRIALARALSEADSIAAAARVMQRAVQAAPENAWAHYWRGAMAEARGRTQTAIQSYRSAVQRQPKMLEAQVKLAGALFRSQRLDAAQKRLETIVERNPVYSAQSWFNLGVVRLKNKQTAAARKAFAEAVRLDPDLVQGHMQLGRLASQANRYEAAARHFRRAIAVDSTHAEAYGSLGIVYLRMNRPNRARRMFETVLELDPDNRAARRILKRLRQ